MRFIVILFVIVTLGFALVNSQSVNIEIDTKEDDLRAENCKFPKHSPFRRECAFFKCSKDRTRVKVIPCPYSPCPVKLSYNEETFAKPFPECCAPPVC